MPDPYSSSAAEERRLALAIRRMLDSLGGVPSDLIEAAIRAAAAEPIEASRWWRAPFARLERALVEALSKLAGRGAEDALQLPAVSAELRDRIAELARLNAGRAAVDLAQSTNSRSRTGLRQIIGQAAADIVRAPGGADVGHVIARVKSMIGLTPKQADRIEALRRALLESGMSASNVDVVIKTKAREMRGLRARQIAERGLVESIATARHQAWVEARAAGTLPTDVMKRWRDQGDDRVRESHRRQSQRPAIALDQIYEIQRVLHPPAPDFGCRCWEELVFPDTQRRPWWRRILERLDFEILGSV